MHIKRIFYQNFRNLQSLDIDVAPGFSLFFGLNGAGKTNFLEGIYFGASLKRFPESKLSQLFFENQRFFKIILETTTTEQDVLYKLTETGYSHELKCNQQSMTRVFYTGQLSVVSFLPQDLNLLTHSPSIRRRYLDETLSFVSPQYRFASMQYQKVLRQRNELLSNINAENAISKQFDVWNDSLADFGSEITSWRSRFIEFLNQNIAGLLKSLSPNLGSLRFAYRKSGEEDKLLFLEKIAGLHIRECEQHTTIVGPHRDDFQTFIGNHDAVGYASRGQMRIIVMALKILEGEYLKQYTKVSPVMLLDDVFSEFDPWHQEAMIEFLKTLPQTFLTTAHPNEIQNKFPMESRLYKADKGIISPVA